MSVHPVSLDTLALWVEGDLPASQAAEVAAHLAGCPTCREEAEALRTSQAWLRDGGEPPFTPEDRAALRAAVLARLPAVPTPQRRVLYTWGALLATAAAVLLVLAPPRAPREVPPAGPPPGAIPSHPAERAPLPALPSVARRAAHRPKARPARSLAPEGELAAQNIRIELQSPDPTIRILWLPNVAAAPPTHPDPSRASKGASMPRAPFSPFAFLALASTLAFPAAAQSPTPAPEPAYVTHKDFRSKLFLIKHRDARDLSRSLYSLGSGAKGAEIVANRDLGTLSVRDYPENIAAIEDALKRLDVPAAHGQTVEFQVHVLFASRSPVFPSDYPEELRDVLAALKSTLSYRTYTQAASLVQRGQEGSRGVSARGTTEVQVTEEKGGKVNVALPFVFQIDAFKVETPASGPALIKLDKMTFEFYAVPPEWQTKIQSDLTLKAGEKVVVGTSTLKGQGVVVVLSAQVVK